MTADTSTKVQNLSVLTQHNFQFKIHRAPGVEFFIREVNIPQISMDVVKIPNPFIPIPSVGDHMIFEPLKIRFMVDEAFQNYLEIFNWLVALASPTDTTGYLALEQISKLNPVADGLVSDLTLILQNAEKEPKLFIEYKDAFPSKLGNLQFVTENDDVKYSTCDAEFQYMRYTISPYN